MPSMRFDLGFAASNAGTSDTVGQPVDFGGVGTRMGVGMGYGLTDTLGLVAEVGYHGSFGAGEAAALSGIVGGYDDADDLQWCIWLVGSIHELQRPRGVGWSNHRIRSVQTQGINVSVDQVEYIVGQGLYTCTGSLLATGLSGGVTYAGMDVGEGLLGGVSTYVGAQSDGTRWYTWGQVSLTVKGQ